MRTLGNVIESAKNSGTPGDKVAAARYLFKWMCSEVVLGENASAIGGFAKAQLTSISGASDADLPIDVFILGIQIGKSSYASAYGRLCALAGIECRQVSGSLRGVGLRTLNYNNQKRRMTVTQAMMASHSWSLLTIDEHRQLLACCQCAVQRAAPIEVGPAHDADAAEPEDGQVEAVVDEFFFGTRPERFVYSHFPTESGPDPNDPDSRASDKMQLLDSPISQFHFYTSPLVTSAMYALGLDFTESSRRSIFVVNDSKDFTLELEWKTETDAINAADFRDFRFLFVATDPMSGERLKEEDMSPGLRAYKGSLADFCMLEISERRLSFSLRFPDNGFYRLVAFAAAERSDKSGKRKPVDRSKRARKSSSFLLPPSSSLVPLCEWLIEVDRAPLKAFPQPFPKCQSAQLWGLPPRLHNRFGVSNVPGKFRARIETDENGIAEIYFRLLKPCIFSAKLKLHDEIAPVGASIFHRIVKNVAVFTITIPLGDRPTELGLELFANDPSCDGKTLFGFAQFVIAGPVKPFQETSLSYGQLLLYPSQSSNLLGHTASCDELGLRAVSHPDPMIAVNSSKELELRFSTSESQPLRLIVAMYLVRQVGSNYQQMLQDVSLYTMHHTISDQSIAVVCRFPQQGVYKLQLFAAKYDTQSDLPVVFTYAIFANAKTASCVPFPKQLAAWNGGFLVEPRHGVLEKTNKSNNVTFKLSLPLARKVAVVVRTSPKERVILLNQIQQPDGSSLWEGVLSLENFLRIEVAVIANLATEQDEANFSTLLIYNTPEMFQ